MGAAAAFLGRFMMKGIGTRIAVTATMTQIDVNVCEQAGLDLRHAIDLCAGVMHGIGHCGAALDPCSGESCAHRVESRIPSGGVGSEHRKVLLAQASEQRGDEADADAAAEVAHERGEAADLVVLLLRDSGVTERIDRNEEEGQAESDEDAPADRHAEADVQIDGGHSPKAECCDDESHGDEFAGIEFWRKCAGDREEEHEHQSAGGNGHAGLAGGVAHDLLQKLRDQHSGRVKRDAHHEHDELGHADVSSSE